MKICSTCKQVKPLTEFTLDASKPDGLKHGCKECCAAYQRAYNEKHSERIAKRYAEYCRKNVEKIREKGRKYRAARPGIGRKWNAEWRERNRAHHNAYKAKRRAEKTQATPQWADRQIINDFYAEATHFGLEVDHIVPLHSPLVCGLHWEGNMQLLTSEENARKKNYRWPDMPGDSH